MNNLNHNSRGQVTLFIIIGVIIILFSLIIYSVWNNTTDTENVLTDPAGAQHYLETCMNTLLQNKVEQMALQGGRLDMQTFGLRTPTIITTYGLIQSDLTLPTKSSMETELELFLVLHAQECLQ